MSHFEQLHVTDEKFNSMGTPTEKGCDICGVKPARRISPFNVCKDHLLKYVEDSRCRE